MRSKNALTESSSYSSIWHRSLITQAVSAKKSSVEEKVEFVPQSSEIKKPYHIPTLSVIDAIVSVIPASIRTTLKKTVIAACQHNLETTLTLYKALKKLGVSKIYSVGKCYSDSEIIKKAMLDEGIMLTPSSIPNKFGDYQNVCRQDIQKMWRQCYSEISETDMETIIVIDDGARCLEEMPPFLRFKYRVVGIEQTRGGLYSSELDHLPFPVIEVASSALKKFIEPPFIAKAILRRLDAILPTLNLPKNTTYGVIGNGAIGSAIIYYLLHYGFQVVVYDKNEHSFQFTEATKNLYRMTSVKDIFANAQCIFGCTGTDTTKNIDIINSIKTDTVLISCSSEDREFRTLIQEIARNSRVVVNTLSDIVYFNENDIKIKILQGGYPFNFDKEPWNVPSNEIEPTQSALLGAVIQGTICAKKPLGDGVSINKNERIKLDATIQQFIIKNWAITPAANEHRKSMLDMFNDSNWVNLNSGGHILENELISKTFQSASFNIPKSDLLEKNPSLTRISRL